MWQKHVKKTTEKQKTIESERQLLAEVQTAIAKQHEAKLKAKQKLHKETQQLIKNVVADKEGKNRNTFQMSIQKR